MTDSQARERILGATRELLRRAAGEPGGATSVTVAQVAAAAHVSRATLYRYFPDRATLLRAAGAAPAEADAAANPRARIRAAMIEVVRERGMHAATLEEIAERAGLSRSGLLWHYRNKEELVADFAQNVPAMQRLADAVEQAARDEVPFAVQLERLVGALVDSLDEYGALIPMVVLDAAQHPEVARFASAHTLGRALRLLTELLEHHTRTGALRPGSAAVRAQAAAGLFISQAMLRAALPALAADKETTVREFTQILLYGMLAAPPEVAP